MKVKVNDVELELEPGTSAIDAVFQAGYDVPYFCSKEYMSPVGACRLCIAKVGAPRKDRATGEWILDEETGEPKVFWFPKPMATCTTSVMEGMVIDTKCEETKQAQKSMMEFTLINHPLDCPVCDKGGACELQDRAYEYGDGVSRFKFDKRHQEKHHALSPTITLDRERCIHCKRCVRYFEEIPNDEVIDFIERGGHTFIGSLDEGLPSNFTGNITDICPVGALLDTTSRFRGRNWEYRHTRTTSTDDSSGSAITVASRTGRIERIKSARHLNINHDWIDDGTRFGHAYSSSPERITTPYLKDTDGKLQPASWEEATAYMVQKLQAASNVGVVIRADATLEEAVGAKKLAEIWAHSEGKTGGYDYQPRLAGAVTPTVARATLDDLATSDALFVMADVTEEVPIVDLRIKEALRGIKPPNLFAHGVPIADLSIKERMPHNTEILSVAAPYTVDLMKHAGMAVHYEVAGEHAFLQSLLEIAKQQTEKDEKNKSLFALVEKLQAAENPVLVCGALVLASQAATELANELATLLEAKLMLLAPMANSCGLEPLGHTADTSDLLEHTDALIVSQVDLASNAQSAKKLADKFVVVHSCFMTATAQQADVVLPAQTGYEKTGTVVNLEGRMLPLTAVTIDSGTAADFTGVVYAISEGLGQRVDGRSVRSAQRHLNGVLGLELGTLAPEGQYDLELLKKLEATRGEIVKKKTKQDDNNISGGVAAVIVPTMVRPEYINYNQHLSQTPHMGAVVMHPDTLAAHGLEANAYYHFDIAGTTRYLPAKASQDLPVDFLRIPATADQPAGAVKVDVAKAKPAPEPVFHNEVVKQENSNQLEQPQIKQDNQTQKVEATH